MAWEATAGLNSDARYGEFQRNPRVRYEQLPLQPPDVCETLKLKEQGKKFIIIDPRKTPATQKLADIHLQIQPGTDGALALGMANLIIENDWHDKEYIEKYTYGFEEYAAYVKQFDLETTARITGLDPDDIYEATNCMQRTGLRPLWRRPVPLPTT